MGLLRRCVYGAAIGDAMGVPFEFMPRGSLRRGVLSPKALSRLRTAALAAIFYGGVSDEWLSQLRGREIIDSVLEKAERRIVSILKKALAED